MTSTKLLAFATALSALLLPAAASAQPHRDDYDYMYRFEPEDLVGETLSTTPPLLTVRPKPLRVMLLRPRASFVGEMLKSVEVL